MKMVSVDPKKTLPDFPIPCVECGKEQKVGLHIRMNIAKGGHGIPLGGFFCYTCSTKLFKEFSTALRAVI